MENLAKLFNKLTNSEQKVFTYIYANQQKVIKMKINDLAKETFTSKTVIINLSQKLGFEGFSDLKYYLKSNNSADDDIKVLEDLQYGLKQNIEKTFVVIEADLYKKISREVIEAKTVYVFARGTSKAAGYYLNHLLLTLGIKCIFVKDYNLLTLVGNTLESDELVILISLSGNTEKILEVANIAKVKGSRTIAITSFGNNELSKISDYTLHCVSNDTETKFNDSISRIGMFIVIEMLVNSIKEFSYK
ncbi:MULTISPECIES: MurR/RpiR family transcriptional regulator [Clostridium]|mgnify:CR=1 FL=1|jgi:RpiR family transcriptional regulator, glv operon transcriptional regulator|uniref:MurR/RpiR family transcriptional regulator n=1 Tax=Clostridium TaxID=1485 RepID=UPI001DBA41FD|nr:MULTISPECIES: MurR/RpiR family transcriptional regulator [Clostridium]MBS5305368.1 MurR/RpiR family transcriptional regulator [Clostridium sp.]MBS5883597.1 MurR/RpiR family transcriptional regulator [Clostridium sp.]MBS6500087.1 MurR/RpiR family transcriptional regulator [Clostridium sp.]MDB1942627.1 MurR/RpiR family transcriptional regulator [Clostridium tertium]MDB1949728.1 MurR/RpiR family transcriptional regulator [Clostridium tertium]